MNNAYFMLGNFQVYYSSVVITAGIFLCWVMTLYLYWRSGRNTAAVHVFAVIAFVLSVIISRFLHWYFNSESYSSLSSAMTDYSYGSYALPGMIIAIWISAVIVKKTGLARYAGKLLDCAAPGVCLLIAFIRLSALFNNTCKGKMIIKNESFQFLPIAYPVADAAGKISCRFATFFVQFLIMLIVALLVWNLYFKQQSTKMRKPCPKTGNVARLAMVFYGAVEIIADSTRYDSPLMHFKFISFLNQYSAFISLAQVFAAAMMLGILIYYSVKSIKGYGFSWLHPLCWVMFGAGLFGVGKLGEYNVQRYATYGRCYAIMAVSLVIVSLSIYMLYCSCKRSE